MKKYPEIIIQKQPNEYSCYPTCASILTGIPINKIYETIGHEGSKDHYFTYNELSLALLILGWSIIRLLDYDFDSLIENFKNENLIYRMILLVQKNKNIHAVAWDGQSKFVIDPMKNKNLELVYFKARTVRCS